MNKAVEFEVVSSNVLAKGEVYRGELGSNQMRNGEGGTIYLHDDLRDMTIYTTTVNGSKLQRKVDVQPKTLDDAYAARLGSGVAGLGEATKPYDTQVGGSHYTKLKIQPMQYSMANGLDALQHTVVKYVTRFRDKNGIEDLEKAKHAIDMLIQHEKEAGRAQV